MKFFTVVFVLTLIFSCSSLLYASEITILRVSCMQSDIGTKIYLNDKFKGECDGSPVDIMAPSGPFTLRAYKQVGAEREQTYTTEGTLVAGVAKRINVLLSAPKLTAAAQKAYDRTEKLRREKAEKEEQLRLTKAREKEAKRQSQLAAEEMTAASDGDLEAMESLVQRYQTGNGVKQDSTKAKQWLHKINEILVAQAVDADMKAAQSGDMAAMKSMARRYVYGNGVEKDSDRATHWQQKIKAAEDVAKQKKIAQQKRQVNARKRAQLQAEKNTISYRKNQKALDNWFGDKGKVGPFEALVTSVISLPAMAGATVMDLVLTPTRISESMKISKELNAHASTWAKPDSMMAKAYRQQRQGNTTESSLIVATR